MTLFNKSAICLLGLLLSLSAGAQNNRSQLEGKRKKLEKDISYKNTLLKETRQGKQSSMNELLLLNTKISDRESLIGTYRVELRILEKNINKNRALIKSLEDELARLKDEYAKMVYYAYINRNAYSRIMFIFSSRSFNQAYNRLKYFQQYTAYRKTQASLIIKTQETIEQKIGELQHKMQEKEGLLENQRAAYRQLAEEKTEQQSVFISLREKERELRKEITRKKQQALDLKKAIDRLIEEEMRKASSKTLAMTPEYKKLSAGFANNKGKLPWPVVKGQITGRFGPHPHPVLPGITIQNNGIDIVTTAGAKVRCVFDGRVTGVVIVKGTKAIMVRHGDYISIYSNLRETYVKKGDKVKTKQELGVLATDKNGKTEINFQVWKGREPQNPAYWLYRIK